MKAYTVIVELPRATARDYGQPTRLAYVQAESAKQAKSDAETDTLVFFIEASELDRFEGEHGTDCFRALHCFEGRLTDL